MGRPAKSKTKLGQRLIDLRDGEARVDFCQRIGVKPETYTNYERGTRPPDAEVLEKVRIETGVDMNWLFTGKGEMYLPDEPPAHSLDANLMEIVVNTVSEHNAKTRAKLPPEKYWLVYMICYRKLEEVKDKYPAPEARTMLRQEVLDLLKLATLQLTLQDN